MAQWMARRYGAPSLTVIFDNQGWAAPALSALAVHPSGATAAMGAGTGFAPEADLPGVAAAAGGAYAATVTQAAKLPAILARALANVRRGRSAVISVHVPSAAPPPAGPHHPAPVDPGQKEESPWPG
jgi:acetolactate synthase-1/2/3 large subunit